MLFGLIMRGLLWKTIKNWWHLVNSGLIFVVGNGQRVKFWKDRRCRDILLYLSFPSLSAIDCSRRLR